MLVRLLARFTTAVFVAALSLSVALRAQQPPQGPPAQGQPPAGAPGGGRGGFQLKNVKVLKDVPVEQWQVVMQYVAASLGVQCSYCHVQGDNASDDKDTKKRAREMMKMVKDVNDTFFEGKPALSCASCHNGHAKPIRTSPLARLMTPEEAATAAAARERAGRGGPGAAGAPGAPGAPPAPSTAGPGAAGPAAPSVPASGTSNGIASGTMPAGPVSASAAAGRGRGAAAPAAPPAPTETVDQVLAKYADAAGGTQALQNAKTRVMTGTVTNRDLTTANVTVHEKATGEYRIDIAAQPNPIVRATNGATAWAIGAGPGGAPTVRDLGGYQMQQGLRLADFALPLRVKQRYADLSATRYDSVEGKPVVVLTGAPYPHVTEELSFDRESGLLLRRTIVSGSAGGFGIASLSEQVDYSDYREVGGVKTPFTIRHATWNAVTTEKFTDVKINVPIDDTIFAKPAAQP